MFSSQHFTLLVVGAVLTSVLVVLLLPLANRFRAAAARLLRHKFLSAAAGEPAAIDAITEILASLNCESHVIADSDGRRNTVTFDFQGGHFVATIEDDTSHPMFNTVSLSYYGCMSASLADSETLERVINEVNLISLPPKATITPAGENADNSNDALNVNLHISGLRLIADKAGTELFRAMLTSCFHIQRMASDRFDELRRTEPGETVRSQMPYGKALSAMLHAELDTHADQAMSGPWYEMPEWTVGEFFRRVYGFRPDEEMKLIVNGTPAEVADLDAYPIFSLLLTDDAHVGDRATIDLLSADPDTRSYHICLTMQSVDERLYLIHADCTSAGLPVRAYRTIESAETEADIRTVTVGIHRGGPEAFKAEAEYMAQEEGLVKKCTSGDAAYSLYWGRVLFADRRLPEAEHYLRNAWQLMGAEISKAGGESDRELVQMFEDTCYFLGQLYYQLGRYADSYLYMDMIVQNSRLRWTQQYLLTLQAMDDPRLPQIMRNLRENSNPENQPEETVEGARQLMDFLDRREIVADIKCGKTESAHEKLMKMLEANPDDEFALSWLSRLLDRGDRNQNEKD